MDHLKLLCEIGELDWVLSDSRGIGELLQKVVHLVSQHLSVDVCSIYLYRSEQNDLILSATEGLNASMVNKITLKPGEGLAGLALKELRPICTNEASSHPNFKLFKGLKEENFDPFVAVPLNRGLQKIGVLVAQRRTGKNFTEPDITALRALTSQIAHTLENARLLMELKTNHEIPPIHHIINKKLFKGQVASAGFAHAPSYFVERRHSLKALTRKLSGRSFTPDDIQEAFKMAASDLLELQRAVEEELSDGATLVFSAHLLLLKDDLFGGRINTLAQNGMPAVKAITKVTNDLKELLGRNENHYIREKSQDIEDITLRILRNLAHEKQETDLYQNHIVITCELLPSDILIMAAQKVAGIISISGGTTAHVSLLARSLRIPLVIADNPELIDIPDETPFLLDAEAGSIYIDPPENICSLFRTRNQTRLEVSDKSVQEQTTTTLDGKNVALLVNINLLTDLKAANALAVDGIGLYRTEFPFIIRSTFPTEEEQYLLYKKVVDDSPNGEVTFRTLDIGGDKVLSYFHDAHEANPFLGMRSLRFCFEHQDIFTQQIRAILRAGKGAKLSIMFPMVGSLDDYRRAKKIVLQCVNELTEKGLSFNPQPRMGIMVEIPSLLEVIDTCAKETDFFCLGTNDFVQYLLAVDRTNAKVAQFYRPHEPAVLKAIKRVVMAAHSAKIEVSLCGDMAHQQSYLPFLLGIGIRRFSVDALYIPRLRSAMRSLHTKNSEKLAAQVLSCETAQEVELMLNMH